MFATVKRLPVTSPRVLLQLPRGQMEALRRSILLEPSMDCGYSGRLRRVFEFICEDCLDATFLERVRG